MTAISVSCRTAAIIAATLILTLVAMPATGSPSATAIPVGFEANAGQSDKAVRFLARHPTYTLFLTAEAAVLAASNRPERMPDAKPGAPARGMVVTLKLVDAQPKPKLAAEGGLPGKVNYFVGRDPKRWQRGLKRHARVRYAEPWPGIDQVWQARPGALSYSFEVAPGADPQRIALAVPQARKLWLDDRGGMVVATDTGSLRMTPPLLYQVRDGRRQLIDGAFELRGKHRNVIGFKVAKYDRRLPLIIDPTLDFASYYGGNDGESYGNQDWSGEGGLPPGLIVSEFEFFDIDVDDAGHLYATGLTASADFPGADPSEFEGSYDVFAMRIDFTAAGPVLGYATFFGGSAGDQGHGIVATPEGDAFVTGMTRSQDMPTNADLPTSAPALQTEIPLPGAVNDAFVARFDAGGDLIRATYLGGQGNDHGNAIAIDEAFGTVVLAGSARRNSADYSAPATPGAYQPLPAKGWEAFIARVDVDLSTLHYYSFYGGDQNDEAYDLAVLDGHAYFAGVTYSPDFPVTTNATQGDPGVPEDLLAGCVFDPPSPIPPPSCADGFVVSIDLSTGLPDYATFLGSANFDAIRGIAVDDMANVYVAGSADSGLSDVEHEILIAKLDDTGQQVWRHHHGGASRDTGVDADVDETGRMHVTGWTISPGLATPDAYQATFEDEETDAFFAIFRGDGASYSYFTYLGGNYFDYGLAIARDGNDYTYLGGITSSNSFPLLAPLDDTHGDFGSDLFFARFSPEVSGVPVVLSTSVDPETVAPGTPIDYWINVENPNEVILEGLTLVDHLPLALEYTNVAITETIGIDCTHEIAMHAITCAFVGQEPFAPPGLLPGLSSVHVTADVVAVNLSGIEEELCNHVTLEGPSMPAVVFDCHTVEPEPMAEADALLVSVTQEVPGAGGAAEVGDPIKFDIQIANTGDVTAHCLHLRVESAIEGSPVPVLATPAVCEPDGSCYGAGDGVCLGPLAVDETVQAKFQSKAPPPAGSFSVLAIAQEDGNLFFDEAVLSVTGPQAEVEVAVGEPEPYTDGWYRAPVYISTDAPLAWVDLQVTYAPGDDGDEVTRAWAYVPPTLTEYACFPAEPMDALGGVGCHLQTVSGTSEVQVFLESSAPPMIDAVIYTPASGDDLANNEAHWP